MFGWGKKKTVAQDTKVYAPVKGHCIPLEKVADPVFASKMMGDGFAVEPQAGSIVAPVTGKVTMIQGHAIGITRDDGLEFLLHLGIDTVQLEGRPFQLQVELGQTVEGGTHIGEAEWSMVEQAGVLKTTLVLMTNAKDKTLEYEFTNGPVEVGTPMGQVRLSH